MFPLKNKYPIGEYSPPENFSPTLHQFFIQEIHSFPSQLAEVVLLLNDGQLEHTYREGSWTIRQVVHHIADAQLNLFPRIKFALSEDNPTIKPYIENAWAEFIDSTSSPINASLKIIEGLHLRFGLILEKLTKEEWKKCFFHPETGTSVSIESLVSKLVWHNRHHYTQILNAKTFYKW